MSLFHEMENKLRLDGQVTKDSRIARRDAKNKVQQNASLNNSTLNNSKCLNVSKQASGKNRSRSSSKSPSRGTGGDRFMPKLGDDAKLHALMSEMNISNQTPQDKEEKDLLATISSVASNNTQRGILSYANKPKMMPGSAHGSKLVFSATKSTKAKTSIRYVETSVDKILDAPCVEQDFNINILDWGENNIIAVALANQIFLWNAETSAINELCSLEENTKVTSIKWIDDCNISFGDSRNRMHVWDATEQQSLRKMRGHAARVSSIAVGQGQVPWLLTCGSKSGEIHNYDVRKPNPFLSKFNVHTEEVSGLSWSPDGRLLASGGIDNVVGLWSNDIGISFNEPMHKLEEHQAGVKAVQWCPWKPQLLATGGGAACKKMIIWNGNSGQKVLDVDTENQVSGIHWNERLREIVTCHGYPNNVLRLWKYPKFSHMIDFEGHDGRILCSSQSPCGKYVCSLGEDETLRLWKVFFSEETETKAKRTGGSRSQTATALSMRF